MLINDVKPSDGGKYQCVARNVAGTKESRQASLSVHGLCNSNQKDSIIIFLFVVRPFFHKEPMDAIILANGTITFECVVGGEPPPKLLWRRDDGKMPIGRAHILDDKALRIERVTPEDEGLYICNAENDVGAISARASLTVHGAFSKNPPKKIIIFLL